MKNRMDRKRIRVTIEKYLKMVNLEEYKYYYPRELSGGMRQKISILRAFAYPSQILIMDEPFKSLDINSKQLLIDFFKELKNIESRTCIIVTHDIEEALTLGDKIIILTEKPTKVGKVIELSERKENMAELKKIIEDQFA